MTLRTKTPSSKPQCACLPAPTRGVHHSYCPLATETTHTTETGCALCAAGHPVETVDGARRHFIAGQVGHFYPCGLVQLAEPHFAAIGKQVMRASECMAVARSRTMALRIANALNRHPANRKGR